MSRRVYHRLRVVVLTAACLLPVWAATAQQTLPAERRPVKLRLEAPPQSVRGPSPAAERAILDAFLREHPWIEVDPYVKLEMEGPRGEATFYMAMAGQIAPDALRVYGRAGQKYIDQNFLYPLDEYLDEQDIDGPMFQKLRPSISRDGQLYGVPAKVAVHALLYRKDLFEQAGLDPNQPPRDWDELLDVARRLTFPDRGQYGFLLEGGSAAGWRFSNFVWQAGGDIVRRQPDGSWRLTLDEPPAIEALDFYHQMRWGTWDRDGRTLQGAARVDSAGQAATHFREGRVAMMIVSTTQDIGRYVSDPSQVGIAPLPAGPAGPAAMLEAEFWGINNLIADDPDRRAAAMAYIRFVTSDRAAEIRTRLYVESGWASDVSPADLERFGYEAEVNRLPPQWLDFYDDLLTHGRIEPYAPNYDQVSTDLMSQLDLVLYSESADPAAVLRSINTRANTAFFSSGVPDEVRHTRRTIAWSVVVVLAAALLVALVIWVRSLRAAAARRDPVPAVAVGSNTRSRRRRLQVIAWLFLLPAVLSMAVWQYYPLVLGARLAFVDYQILGQSTWVGLDNFIEAFTQPAFWIAMWQTCIYVVLALGLGFVAPIVLALLLAEVPNGKYFFRTVFYLPAVTSGLVVMFIWMMMYDGSPDGVFNRALRWMTADPWGRAFTITGVTVAWLGGVGLVVGMVSGWRIEWETRGGFRPTLLMTIGLILGADAATQWVSALVPWAVRWQFILPWFEYWGWRQPIVMAATLGVWALAAGLWTAGVLLRRDVGPAANERSVLMHPWVAPFLLVLAVGVPLFLARTLAPPLRPYVWLQDPTGYWAMLWVVLPGVWAGAGPGCIIYLAALKSIPEELYEAADLDGAGPFHKAWHVTVQYLKPLVIINFIGAFVGTFHAMGNILVMTGGGPGHKTMTIGMDIFFNAFTHLKFGYATAEAWVLGSLLIGFTVYQLRILKQLRFTRAAS